MGPNVVGMRVRRRGGIREVSLRAGIGSKCVGTSISADLQYIIPRNGFLWAKAICGQLPKGAQKAGSPTFGR